MKLSSAQNFTLIMYEFEYGPWKCPAGTSPSHSSYKILEIYGIAGAA